MWHSRVLVVHSSITYVDIKHSDVIWTSDLVGGHDIHTSSSSLRLDVWGNMCRPLYLLLIVPRQSTLHWLLQITHQFLTNNKNNKLANTHRNYSHLCQVQEYLLEEGSPPCVWCVFSYVPSLPSGLKRLIPMVIFHFFQSNLAFSARFVI